jgi:hypothetical protein
MFAALKFRGGHLHPSCWFWGLRCLTSLRCSARFLQSVSGVLAINFANCSYGAALRDGISGDAGTTGSDVLVQLKLLPWSVFIEDNGRSTTINRTEQITSTPWLFRQVRLCLNTIRNAGSSETRRRSIAKGKAY